jgi:hypothetical protein
MRTDDNTNDLAERFAVQDGTMLARWSKEKDARKSRFDVYWSKVTAKRDLAKQLKRKLAELESKLPSLASTARIARAEVPSMWITDVHSKQAIATSAESRHSSAETKISTCKQDVKDAEKSPPPVFEPLPLDKTPALRVLFFQELPSSLRALAGLGFSAQLTLAPRTKASLLETPKVNEDWSALFNRNGGTTRVQFGKVEWGTFEEQPNEHGPGHIDQLRQRSQGGTGIWHPAETTVPQWSGGGFALDTLLASLPVNPFLPFPFTDIVEGYTERLPTSSASLEWCMPQFGESAAATRENEGLATQGAAPDWMSKTEYLAFRSLRSELHLQIRKLCVALREGILPINRVEVRALVQQSMYHTGSLVAAGEEAECSATSEVAVVPLWRTDLLRGGLLSILEIEIERRFEEVQAAPGRHEDILLLGDLAAHLSDYGDSDLKFHKIAVGLARVASNQAEVIWQEIEQQQQVGNALVRADRAKQCALYEYALLCYALGPLDVDDVSQICQLLVRFYHSMPRNEDGEQGDYT